jgi:hypothetical protein
MSIMNPKFFIIAAVLGMGLVATSTFAQNDIITAIQADVINATRHQMELDNQKRNLMSSLLDGSLQDVITSTWIRRTDVREGMGISDEQNRQIQEGMRNIDQYFSSPDAQNDPD